MSLVARDGGATCLWLVHGRPPWPNTLPIVYGATTSQVSPSEQSPSVLATAKWPEKLVGSLLLRQGEREREREREGMDELQEIEEIVGGLARVEEDDGASIFMEMEKMIYVRGEVWRLLPISFFFFFKKKGNFTQSPSLKGEIPPYCLLFKVLVFTFFSP